MGQLAHGGILLDFKYVSKSFERYLPPLSVLKNLSGGFRGGGWWARDPVPPPPPIHQIFLVCHQ